MIWKIYGSTYNSYLEKIVRAKNFARFARYANNSEILIIMSYIFIYYPLIWIVVNVQPRVVIFCADNNYVPKLRDHNFNTLKWKNVRIFAMMTSVNAVPIIFKETMINLLYINVILEYKNELVLVWPEKFAGNIWFIIPKYVIYQIYDKH